MFFNLSYQCLKYHMYKYNTQFYTVSKQKKESQLILSYWPIQMKLPKPTILSYSNVKISVKHWLY